MLIKIISFICIVGSCSYFGFFFAKGYELRQIQLSELIIAFDALGAEIGFLKTPLSIAFYRVSKIGDGATYNFMETVHKNLAIQDLTVLDVFKKSLSESDLAIKKQDEKAILDFAATLGSLEVKSQMIQFELLKERLEESLKNAISEREKYSRLIKSAGLMSGIAVFLLLV